MAVTTRSGVETPSQMMDSWIRVREPLLAMLLPKGLDKPLNETARGETSLPHPDLAAELRRAMDEMIVSSIDSQGMSVDYEGLRTGPAYLGFRRECSASLVHQG